MLTSGELKSFHEKISQYHLPEDLFGFTDETDTAILRKKINDAKKDLLKKFHPDFYESATGNEKYFASQISAQINELYDAAIDKIDKGTYGAAGDEMKSSLTEIFKVKTGLNEYRVVESLLETDFSQTYRGEYTDESGQLQRAFIKVCTDIDNNILYRNELKILGIIKHKSLSTLIDHFITTDGQEAMVLKFIRGYDLFELRERFPSGIPEVHAFWILERLLSALGHIHFNVIVHGNIEPGNVIVRPKDHNVVIVDYKTACHKPRPHDFYSIATEGYSAPEVLRKEVPIPHSDIYSVGKCMIFLLGGDVGNNLLPAGVNRLLQRFILNMVTEDLKQRPFDAWKLCSQFSDLRLSLFGKRHLFQDFIVPNDKYPHPDTGKSAGSYTPAGENIGQPRHVISLVKRESGVFEVPVSINKVMIMNFILDSGASEVSISPDVASVLLKSGSISPADVLAPMNYRLADGSVASCQRYNLKTLELDGGLAVNNIAASVSESHTSPLLLGQNVLAQLGNVRIDYANGLMILD